MVDNFKSKKTTVRLRTPNPLFEKWLSEWHQDELSSQGVGDTIFSKALQSLKKYPLFLNSGLECIILEHFDDQLCLKLNKRLEEHNNNGRNEVNSMSIENNIISKKPGKRKQHKEAQKQNSQEISSPQKGSPKRKTKPYVPAKRSAAYALLMALINSENENGYSGSMLKEDLTKKAQAYCDVSIKKPAPGSYYSGWSSMSQLVAKGLVEKNSNPAKFSLTEKGRALALSLKSDQIEESNSEISSEPSMHYSTAPVPSLVTSELFAPVKSKGRKKAEVNEPSNNSEEKSSQSHEFETEEMIFLPSTFDIILLMDTAETEGSAKRYEDRAIISLRSTGIKFEVRHLKVGDYIWIARDSIGREMVLPYIVERKRLDDLGASVKDGRFLEQKFRIEQCGLQNRIYLVEDSGSERNGLDLESIRQAISNTMVCDKFSVKWTDNILDSIQYLARVTKILTQTFKNKTLFSCKRSDLAETIDLEDDLISLLSFQDFSLNMGKIKALCPREMFAKMLIQLHGLSGEIAWVITEHYPTPKLLIEGFLSGEAEIVIPNLTYGLQKSRVGPQTALTLKTFYTTREFAG